jgi:glucosylceramidase
LQVTAAQNPDGSIAVVVFNEGNQGRHFMLQSGEQSTTIFINPQAIQTIIISPQT